MRNKTPKDGNKQEWRRLPPLWWVTPTESTKLISYLPPLLLLIWEVGEIEGKVVCCPWKQLPKKKNQKKKKRRRRCVSSFSLMTNPNPGPKFPKYGATKPTTSYSGIHKHYCFFVHSKWEKYTRISNGKLYLKITSLKLLPLGHSKMCTKLQKST